MLTVRIQPWNLNMSFGHFGQIDMVVANAGMFNPKSVVDTTEEEIANATSTNDRFFLPLPGPQSLRYSGMAGATKKYECPLFHGQEGNNVP